MKCCFLNNNLLGGGAERLLVNLIREWPRSDSCTLMLLENKEVWVKDLPEGTPLIPLSPEIPKGLLNRLAWAASVFFRYRSNIRQINPDVVVTCLWFSTLVAALHKFLFRTPERIAWSLQVDLERNLKRTFLGRIALPFLVRLFRHSVDIFIAPSPAIGARTERLLGVAKGTASVIPNPVELNKVPLRNHHGTDRFLVTSVGRLHIAKNFELLLAAIAQIKDRYPTVQCRIVGDGPERQALKDAASALSLNNVVTFTGFTERPLDEVAKADVFVSTSNWETFGVAIAEAMATGCPVIATATDGAGALIKDNRNGRVVPVNDVTALVQALINTREFQDKTAQMASEAQKDALKLEPSAISAQYRDQLCG